MGQDAEEARDLRRLLNERTDELEKLRVVSSGLETIATQFKEAVLEARLQVSGCSACSGDHQGVWAQKLDTPFPEGGYQRAFICPTSVSIVLVGANDMRPING